MNFNLEKYKKTIKAIGEPPKDDDPERDKKWLEWYDAYHAETTFFLEQLEKELREALDYLEKHENWKIEEKNMLKVILGE